MIEIFRINFKNYFLELIVFKEVLDDGVLVGNRRFFFVYLYFFLE